MTARQIPTRYLTSVLNDANTSEGTSGNSGASILSKSVTGSSHKSPDRSLPIGPMYSAGPSVNRSISNSIF